MSTTILTAPGADQRPRWQPGERLHHLFEHRCDEVERSGQAAHLAVDSAAARLRYDELDALANRLARHLQAQGCGAGDRIGLLFDKSAWSYAAMLAVLKIHAAYVPLDASFPADRIDYIVADAGVRLMLSTSGYRALLASTGVPLLCVDEAAAAIAARPAERLSAAEAGAPVGELCYVIYTSGTTGRPKGVPIDHASIVNFVRVAAEEYGYLPSDRVYQGLTLAFDFAVEEIWVPLVVGATLLPNETGSSLLGEDLARFLREQRASALCCVPTLLATLDEELPLLRLLIVSGEACPRDLVTRWHRPGRSFLNAYGPTEATVTATLGRPQPGQAMTIGRPLPTYAIVILAPDEARALPFGSAGEIGIAGIGIASGYLNRPDLSAQVFIDDFLGIAENASQRIYRTGDLGRVNAQGEVEYLGRIDTQVKIRGYRIELAEIETVLLQRPDVAQAVVNTWESSPGVTELVAYLTQRPGASALNGSDIAQALRSTLPSYMVPAFYEVLTSIPMLASNKADRKALPPPQATRLQPTQRDFLAPRSELEEAIARIVADVLQLERVSADDHLFDDLGANSLLAARLCTRLRQELQGQSSSGKKAGLAVPSPSPRSAQLSMREMYLHPSVQQLAQHLRAADAAAPAAGVNAGPARQPRTPHHASTAAYLGCGATQALLSFAFIWAHSSALWHGYHWAADAASWPAAYGRALALSVAYFLGSALLPVPLKWLLVGRQQARDIPIWSGAYLRFWAAKQLVRLNPIAVMSGTPVYTLYLKLMGARLSWQALVALRVPPACPDMLSVGAGSVLTTNVILNGYKAEAGWIRLAPVEIGRDVYVGEGSVVDIGCVFEDGSQLAHASAVLEGQRLSAGQSYHGSPAQPATQRFAPLPSRAPASALRQWLFSISQMLTLWCFYLPLPWLAAYGLLGADSAQPAASTSASLSGASSAASAMTASAASSASDIVATGWWQSIKHAAELLGALESGTGGSGLRVTLTVLAVSGMFYLLSVIGGLVSVIVLPRLLQPGLRTGQIYLLYGVHHLLHRNIRALSNSTFYNNLFGDSSYIITYLRAIGYRFRTIEQTGSNFGLMQRHDSPALCEIGAGTIVSDGLIMLNADYGPASFRLQPVLIGAKNFLGNNLFIPSQSRAGSNCLLGTKLMVPTDGEMRHDTGLLGSPPFAIPRSVRRDHRFDHYKRPEVLAARLQLKNRANALTALYYLLSNGFIVMLMTLLWHLSYARWQSLGGLYLALFNTASMVMLLGYHVLLDGASRHWRRLAPQFCSIYDAYFWGHERHWKLALNNEQVLVKLLNGTPFKTLLWRATGMRVGRQLFDDGASIPEKTLVDIGDHCTLNDMSLVQSHSLEDGTFKSDHIRIGNDCTLGAGCFVHYDVVLADRAEVAPDAFVMKGERLVEHSHWLGNPAREAQS